jgi:excisionase family DNA binding protein
LDDDRLLTVPDVARILGAQPETVRRWLRAGALRGFRPGGKRLGYRIRESEIRRFLAEREGKAAA